MEDLYATVSSMNGGSEINEEISDYKEELRSLKKKRKKIKKNGGKKKKIKKLNRKIKKVKNSLSRLEESMATSSFGKTLFTTCAPELIRIAPKVLDVLINREPRRIAKV